MSLNDIIEPLEGGSNVVDPPTTSVISSASTVPSAVGTVSTLAVSRTNGTSVVSTVSAGAPQPSVVQPAKKTETQVSEVEKLRKDLEDMKKKAGAKTVDGAISTLQALVGRPTALFDAYAAMAALEEVVATAQNLTDDRTTKYSIILRKCRPLVGEPALQQILTKLVASKEEAEIAKAIDKTIRLQCPSPMPDSMPSPRFAFAGRTNRQAPYRRQRGPRRCFVGNQEGHIARFCPQNSLTVKRR
ncbi:uncharacterized protein LOC114575145 [Exaiptasia diaphana]|uniref:Uncharacterized protein n=1 Tax=Exaiptasia diaphana TaxID=2652724 RepID=A0A913YJJ8_EXADI|nr:uncharacterized protein LOC114575145 [Exaiptasia diaphana]KXJ13531.1 hypothetical protein AC249_AIPGENE25368 [Exaiptasia diaphana]